MVDGGRLNVESDGIRFRTDDVEWGILLLLLFKVDSGFGPRRPSFVVGVDGVTLLLPVIQWRLFRKLCMMLKKQERKGKERRKKVDGFLNANCQERKKVDHFETGHLSFALKVTSPFWKDIYVYYQV